MNLRCYNSRQIKAEALRLGFSACGFAHADAVTPSTSDAFMRWLERGNNAGMEYMANYLERRLDPRLLMEGTQTVISVALNYYPTHQLSPEQYQFAWYAYGKDYHDVMKSKLKQLEAFIISLEEDSNAATAPSPADSPNDGVATRVFCDTAPVLERYWAWQAGLGWQGKNTQLIIPHAGSTYFLGEIFINRRVTDYDTPQQSRCGTCHRCIDRCPTKALEAPYSLNARRCLSYLTIEHRDEIPASESRKMGNCVYGCDECQRACPWLRFATPTSTPEFQPSVEFMSMTPSGWDSLTEEEYRRLFKGSAVKRAKYSGLTRNIRAVGEERERKEQR
jgi:epoxyqueuosine reductase